METNKIFSQNVVIGLIVAFIFWWYFFVLHMTIDPNYSNALSTLIVGSFAFYLYITQRYDSKKDAAKIILQEIRRAEDIIGKYKKYHTFSFTEKIIGTNSWAKNIHHFVDDLSPDQLDKISTLYSTGEYLDIIITKVSDFKFDSNISTEITQQITRQLQIPPSSTLSSLETQNIGPQNFNLNRNLNLHIQTWNNLFNKIVSAYDPIYDSAICERIKKIADIK